MFVTRLGYKDPDYNGVLKGQYRVDKFKLLEFEKETLEKYGNSGMMALQILVSHPSFKVGDYDPTERKYLTDLYENSFMDRVIVIDKDELEKFCVKI